MKTLICTARIFLPVILACFLGACGRSKKNAQKTGSATSQNTLTIQITNSIPDKSFPTSKHSRKKHTISRRPSAIRQKYTNSFIDKSIKDMRQRGDPSDYAPALAQAVRDKQVNVTEIVTMTKDADDSIAELGARTLAFSGTAESLTALADSIRLTPSNDRKNLLAEAGEDISEKNAAGTLFKMLDGENDDHVLDMAQIGLANIADTTLLHDLTDRFKKTDNNEIKDNYADTVRQITNEDMIPSLIEMAHSYDANSFSELSAAAIEALGSIGTPEAVRYMLNRIPSAGKEESTTLALSIERITDYDSLPILRHAAEGGIANGDPFVRTVALHALGNYDDQENVDFLKHTMASESDRIYRAAASNALDKIQKNQ